MEIKITPVKTSRLRLACFTCGRGAGTVCYCYFLMHTNTIICVLDVQVQCRLHCTTLNALDNWDALVLPLNRAALCNRGKCNVSKVSDFMSGYNK